MGLRSQRSGDPVALQEHDTTTLLRLRSLLLERGREATLQMGKAHLPPDGSQVGLAFLQL